MERGAGSTFECDYVLGHCFPCSSLRTLASSLCSQAQPSLSGATAQPGGACLLLSRMVLLLAGLGPGSRLALCLGLLLRVSPSGLCLTGGKDFAYTKLWLFQDPTGHCRSQPLTRSGGSSCASFSTLRKRNPSCHPGPRSPKLGPWSQHVSPPLSGLCLLPASMAELRQIQAGGDPTGEPGLRL